MQSKYTGDNGQYHLVWNKTSFGLTRRISRYLHQALRSQSFSLNWFPWSKLSQAKAAIMLNVLTVFLWSHNDIQKPKVFDLEETLLERALMIYRWEHRLHHGETPFISMHEEMIAREWLQRRVGNSYVLLLLHIFNYIFCFLWYEKYIRHCRNANQASKDVNTEWPSLPTPQVTQAQNFWTLS